MCPVRAQSSGGPTHITKTELSGAPWAHVYSERAETRLGDSGWETLRLAGEESELTASFRGSPQLVVLVTAATHSSTRAMAQALLPGCPWAS